MSAESRYTILEKIGVGSFATVYRARDNELGREVAIKQLHSEFIGDQQRLERFWQEAQLLASLHHPNIVTIFDIVRDKGWLVMELMQSSLAARLGGRPVDLRALRATLAHVLRALKYLHSQGIIHGDIKPGNLMIDARKRIKLGDFGLARRVANAEGSLLKGTTKYMAPETVSDDFGDVGPQSDLYSLGFSAYDLMCGENFEELFPGLNAKGKNQQLAWMMWHAAPDRQLPEIDRVLTGVPPDVAKVVQKLVQKDPAKRYKSADEALSDLQIDLKVVGSQAEEVSTDAAPDPDKRQRIIAIGALAFSVMMSGALLFWPSGNPSKVESRKQRGLVRDVDVAKNEFVVQDLNTGTLEVFKVPRKQRIYLLNDKKNILLREVQAGDHVEMDVDKKVTDLVVDMHVDRPVPTRGKLKQLNLPENRIVIGMEEGNTRDDLPVRVPETAKLVLNGRDIKLRDLQEGDRLEVTHLSEPGEAKGRVVNSLVARRSMTTVGFVSKYDADATKLTLQVGSGTAAGTMTLGVTANCKVVINGASEQNGQPFAASSLRPGDRVSIIHDSDIVEIAATRQLSFEGTVHAITPVNGSMTMLLPSGERKQLVLAANCEITLGLERIEPSDLRQFDTIKTTYSEQTDGTLRALTIDARRPAQADRWTVVLGTQGYSDTTLSPIRTALNDARLVHGKLITRYAVSDQRAALLLDAPKKDWERQLTETFANARPQTQVIIFVTGHAFRDENGKVYLAAKDFDFSNPAATGLPLDWLAQHMSECQAKDKVLILDVTHSITGRDKDRQVAGKDILEKLATPFKAVQVLVSCSAGEQSRIWVEKQHNIFAWWLADALQGYADSNRDLRLTSEELNSFIQRQAVNAETKVFAVQTPVMLGE